MLLVYINKLDCVKALKANMAQHMQNCGLGYIVGWVKNSRATC